MLTKETLLPTKNAFDLMKNLRPQNLKPQSSNPRMKIAKTKTHHVAKTANPKNHINETSAQCQQHTASNLWLGPNHMS